jgi:hypothetical protein
MHTVDVMEHTNYEPPQITILTPPASNLQRMHPVVKTFETSHPGYGTV